MNGSPEERPSGWSGRVSGLTALDAGTTRQIDALPLLRIPAGQVLFHPGEAAKGFVVVLTGRIEVFLTGPSGRDILLYAVEPGSSCVQSTLSLLGGEDYTGEAVAAVASEAVLIPRGLFLSLMGSSAAFRTFVFTAFAARMQAMMHLLERVAFQRVESRLALALLDLAEGDAVRATQAELATRIGSAREVVSRRLDALAAQGLVATERGLVRLADRQGLARLAAAEG
jgi:CRP/FNR family transcriptional regulator